MISHKNIFSKTLLFSLCISSLNGLNAAERIHQDLSGKWQAGSSDNLKLQLPPPVKNWKSETVPHKNGTTPLIKTNGGPYMPNPATLLTKDGKSLKKTKDLTAWFRREFSVKAADLQNHIPMLHLGGAAYRSAIWINGKKAGETVQCCTPLDFSLKGLLKPGKNQITIAVTDREGLLSIPDKCYVSPCNGIMAGIRGPVQIDFLPETFIEDVYIRTSVKNKKIDFDITLVNSGNKSMTVNPVVKIKEERPDSPALKMIEGKPVIVKPGEKKPVTLSANWIAPRLWDVSDGYMYDACITLSENNKSLDRKVIPFGFREFEIKGRDFYLNGSRIVMLRNSTLTRIGAENPPETDNVYNCYRQHLGFNNMNQIKSADRIGKMIIPESSWSWVHCFPHSGKSVWLDNTKEYFKRWIKHLRNHPSIVMWSLANETYWDRRKPEELAIAGEILKTVKNTDPVRPQQGDGECSWNGILPSINIHYPESAAGDVRAQYPNSGIVIPNDFYWLKKDGKSNKGWRAEFVWDRPLMIGEYYWISGSPERFTSFMGDSVYDWEKWRRQELAGRDGQSGREYNNRWTKSLQKMTDIYRMQGVACVNPWSGDRSVIAELVTVRPFDYYPNFAAGEKGEKTMVVINDSRNRFTYLTLQCFITVDGATVWHKKIRCNTPPGKYEKIKVEFDLPEVSKITKAEFTARLVYWRAGGYHQKSRHVETMFIIPKRNLAALKDKVVLYSKNANAGKALAAVGIKVDNVKQLTSSLLRGKKLVIIGKDSLSSGMTEMLDDFVVKGGQVLILPQKDWKPFRPELPESDTRHVASQAWLRAAKHPIMQDMSDGQFSYWRPDNLISKNTFVKPTAGRFNILLDCGGNYGVNWTPLLAVGIGKGEYIMSSIDLCAKASVEPAAAYLLGSIVEYCVHRKAEDKAQLNLLCGKNQALKDSLALVGAVCSDGIGKTGPVLVDSSADISVSDLKELKAALQSGRRIWLHGFTPESIAKVSGLFHVKPQLVKPDPTVQSCVIRSNNPVISGLSNFDFYWTRVDLGSRADFFQDGKPTAKTGDWILQDNNLSRYEKLIEPGFMYNIKTDGKGEILFDTLQWENAFNTESEKSGRILASILSNIGAELKLKPEVRYDFFHVDLSKFANMGYYDKVADDKKGGWTDQGKNDMRFFLINHTGRDGGRDDGAEVGVGEFPTKINMAKTSFALINPKANNGRSVLAFRGGPHGKYLLEKSGPIPVNKKAQMLWFLQTACWVGNEPHKPVADYIVQYEDGSKVKVPVRTALEVADWWQPAPLPNARVAWTGRNLAHSPIGIWSMPWENPHLDKVIKSITVVGNLSGSQLVLLAISGGNKSTGSVAFGWKSLASWNLADTSNGKCVAEKKPDAVLKVQGNKGKVADGKGYESKPGRYLTSNTKYFPGWNLKPFGVEIVITPSGKPAGYFGGLFQAMQYGKSGFRLMLRHDMKLVAEIYPQASKPLYLVGRTVLKPGRTYNVRLSFDGRKAVLTLDGRPEKIIDSPLPGAYKGDISIGRASGKDYFFNGIIKNISMREK